MKKLFWFALAVCLIICVSSGAFASEASYIVKIKEGYVPNELMELLTEVNKDHRLYTSSDYEKVLVYEDYIEYIEEDVTFDIIDEIAPVETEDFVSLMNVQDTYYSRQWQLTTVKAQYLWEAHALGDGVNVAVIDSGCNPHTDLDGVLKGGYNVMSGADTSDYKDNHGHGTHVTGIIAAQHNTIGTRGIAPNVNIYAIKVTDSGNNISMSTIANAILVAVDSFDCRVINMSLAGSNSTTLKNAVKHAYNKGVILVGAVGNYGDDDSNYTATKILYPAGYDEVIGVAATDKDNKRTSFSQRNNSAFVAAPGYQHYSTSKGGGYTITSGTSQATPMVSAIAAAMLSIKPDMTLEQFKKYIEDNATKIEDAYTGCGIINAEAMIRDVMDDAIGCYISPLKEDGVFVYNNYAEAIAARLFTAESDSEGNEVCRSYPLEIAKGEGQFVEFTPQSGTMYLWSSNLKPLIEPVEYGK